jgi:hypothetical protein
LIKEWSIYDVVFVDCNILNLKNLQLFFEALTRLSQSKCVNCNLKESETSFNGVVFLLINSAFEEEIIQKNKFNYLVSTVNLSTVKTNMKLNNFDFEKINNIYEDTILWVFSMEQKNNNIKT